MIYLIYKMYINKKRCIKCISDLHFMHLFCCLSKNKNAGLPAWSKTLGFGLVAKIGLQDFRMINLY